MIAAVGPRSLPIAGDHDAMVPCEPREEYRDMPFDSLPVPLVDCRTFATRPPAA